jgi:hypothetical protein
VIEQEEAASPRGGGLFSYSPHLSGLEKSLSTPTDFISSRLRHSINNLKLKLTYLVHKYIKLEKIYYQFARHCQKQFLTPVVRGGNYRRR